MISMSLHCHNFGSLSCEEKSQGLCTTPKVLKPIYWRHLLLIKHWEENEKKCIKHSFCYNDKTCVVILPCQLINCSHQFCLIQNVQLGQLDLLFSLAQQHNVKPYATKRGNKAVVGETENMEIGNSNQVKAMRSEIKEPDQHSFKWK